MYAYSGDQSSTLAALSLWLSEVSMCKKTIPKIIYEVFRCVFHAFFIIQLKQKPKLSLLTLEEQEFSKRHIVCKSILACLRARSHFPCLQGQGLTTIVIERLIPRCSGRPHGDEEGVKFFIRVVVEHCKSAYLQ